MIRSICAIVTALNVSAPGFGPKLEGAKLLDDLGRKNGHDPLTLVAIVDGESHWNPFAESSDGSIGLAQIRFMNFTECKEEPEGFACAYRKRSLRQWRLNLMIASGYIRENREYCERRVGSSLAVHWLQGFQGYDENRKTVCGHVRRGGKWVALPIPELTRKVLARRKELAALPANCGARKRVPTDPDYGADDIVALRGAP